MRAVAAVIVMLLGVGFGIANPGAAQNGTPNDFAISSLPMFVETGGRLEVDASNQGTLSLVQDGTQTALETTWRENSENHFVGNSTIPVTMRTGAYSVELATNNSAVTLPVLVYVIPPQPDVIRMWRANDKLGVATDDHSDLDIVLSFEREDLAITDGPVIIVPGEDERDTLPISMQIGELNLLFFDINDQSNRTLGRLHVLRRKLKDKPTTIAISVTPPENLPFRTVSILFVDDPVQGLVLPPSSNNDAHTKSLQQWGKSPVIDAGRIRYVEVGPSGVSGHE